jgi:4-hydroxybenzoate polyprenyltransferase
MDKSRPSDVFIKRLLRCIYSGLAQFLGTVHLCFIEARPVVQGIFLLRIVASVSLAVYATSKVSGVSEPSSASSLAVLGAAWVCITTAVYLYNGVQDVEEDQANASGRPIARGELSVPSARLGACAFGVAGLVGIGIAHTDLIWTAAAMLVLGWMYSGSPLYLKRWPAGLALIVVAAAILTYYSGYTAAGGGANMAPLVVFAGAMAAWMGMVGQTKDLSDVPGDRLAGRRSIPVVWGEDKARAAVSVAAIAVALGFLTGSLYLTEGLLLAAIVVFGGAIAVSALSLGPWGRGDRESSRRPYKAFMVTQYLAHAFIIASVFPVFGI